MMEHLHQIYPGIIPNASLSNMKGTTIDKRQAHFCKTLISVRDSWTKNHDWMNRFISDKSLNVENANIVEQLVEIAFATLDCMVKAARELFDMMEDEDMKAGYSLQSNSFKSVSMEPNSTGKAFCSHSPADSASCPTELNVDGGIKVHAAQNSGPFSPGIGEAGELKPVAKEVKGNSEVTVAIPQIPSKGPVKAVPLPPPMMPSKGSALPPQKRPGPPPPPPLGATKSQLRKAAMTKLKRSTQMSTLFRNLQKNVEGSSKDVGLANERKAATRTKGQIGGSNGGKEGLAASLAELTKRSRYFQQIEEDVQKHEKSIIELKIAISSFQAKDMVKLLKFQRSVESFLGNLTDETQVLLKFEDFPAKKLEALRTAAALHSKLDTMVANLKELEIVAPLDRLFEKIEGYFSKIRKELDAIERTKDEESQKFKRHDIHFDFNILTRIKELMVDTSSSCMELALKEMKEAKAAKSDGEIGSKTDRQRGGNAKMLWRAFQLAYRVYTFAGGQDDRAEKLAEEVAGEIFAGSQQP